MRYITDSDGWLRHVSFGADITCEEQTCTEYTGDLPVDNTGETPVTYASLEAWYLAEADTLYRWKVVDGQLTLDATGKVPAPDRTIVSIENGGTGAITADEALVNLGASARWDVIWENKSPDSAFDAQTLTIERLSDYEDLEFVMLVSLNISTPIKQVAHAYVSTEEQVYIKPAQTMAYGSGLESWERTIIIDGAANTIAFATGEYFGGSNSYSSSVMVPLRIRGRRSLVTTTSAVLGRAILGKMILGKGR